MSRLRKRVLIALIAIGCSWWLYDSLANESNFVRFSFNFNWQSVPVTVIHLERFLPYADKQRHDRPSWTETVTRYGGNFMDVGFVESIEFERDHVEWDNASLFWVQRGSDYSRYASSVALRQYTSEHSALLQSSVDIAIPHTWSATTANTHLVLLVDVRDRRQVESLRAQCLVLARDGASLIAAERAISVRGKRFLNPNLVLIFGFETSEALEKWYRSISIQSELALLDRDVDRIHLLVFRTTLAEPSE